MHPSSVHLIFVSSIMSVLRSSASLQKLSSFPSCSNVLTFHEALVRLRFRYISVAICQTVTFLASLGHLRHYVEHNLLNSSLFPPQGVQILLYELLSFLLISPWHFFGKIRDGAIEYESTFFFISFLFYLFFFLL